VKVRTVQNEVAPRRCAIYTRKSVARGLEQAFNSLEAQYDSCASYIQARATEGWQIIPARYDDGGYSGKDMDRPQFRRLMADVAAGKIDIVVVYKVDRLSRSLLDFAQVMQAFDAAGCAFVSVTQHFSTADAMGRLTLNILMSFAEFEREMIAERTKDKIAAARRRGKWTGGPVPFGYRVADRRLVVEPGDGRVVQHVFRRYEVLKSACLVANELEDAGMARQRVRGGPTRPWDKKDVLRILTNPVYAGFIRCGDERVRGEHEPLIDEATFERVQQLLATQRPRATPKTRNPEYLLRGLLRCGGCGAAMTAASTKATSATYRYYRCTTRDRQGTRACPVQPVPAAAAEAAVVAQIARLAHDPAVVAAVSAEVEARTAQARSALETERGELVARSECLSTEYVERSGAEDEAAERAARLAALSEELALVDARLHHIDDQLSHLARADTDVRSVGELLADFDAVWTVLTPENRGRVVRSLVEHVTVDADGAAHIDLVGAGAAVALAQVSV